MLWVFLLDSGLSAERPIDSTGVSCLDSFKLAIEPFLIEKSKTTDRRKDQFLLFKTTPPHQLAYNSEPIEQVIDRLKMVKASECSDWRGAFGAIDQYLTLCRVLSMQDTIGQGRYPTMVQNAHIFIFSTAIPQFTNDRKLASPPFLDSSWFGDYDRPDTAYWISNFTKRSPDQMEESFRRLLSIKNAQVKVVPTPETKGLSAVLHAPELQQQGPWLSVLLVLGSATARALVSIPDTNPGFWCFPESHDFQQCLSQRKRKVLPRIGPLVIYLSEAQPLEFFKVPELFAVDVFPLTPLGEMPLVAFASQLPQAAKFPLYFPVKIANTENDQFFGYVSISPESSSLTMLPYNFLPLFDLIGTLPRDRLLSSHQFSTFLETVPTATFKPLKASLRLFGLIGKFPGSTEDEPLREFYNARTQLAKSAQSTLEDLARHAAETRDQSLLPASIADILGSRDSVVRKAIQALRTFSEIMKFGGAAVQRKVAQSSLTTAAMGDYHERLAESLRFRDPFDEQWEEATMRSLFSNPFRRRRSARKKHSLQQSHLIDSLALDGFSSEPCTSSDHEYEEPPVKACRTTEYSLPGVETADLIRLIRTPGLNAARKFIALAPSIASFQVGELQKMAARFKRHSLLTALSAIQADRTSRTLS